MIKDDIGVNVDRQRLIHMGRLLKNEQPIKLSDNAIVHLVARKDDPPPAQSN